MNEVTINGETVKLKSLEETVLDWFKAQGKETIAVEVTPAVYLRIKQTADHYHISIERMVEQLIHLAYENTRDLWK